MRGGLGPGPPIQTAVGSSFSIVGDFRVSFHAILVGGLVHPIFLERVFSGPNWQLARQKSPRWGEETPKALRTSDDPHRLGC